MLHFIVKRKLSKCIFSKYKKLRKWVFLNNDFTQIEILDPTLENIELMEKYDLRFVIKGFKSISEYNKWDRLRTKFGIYSTLLMTRCLSEKFMSNVLMSFIEGQSLPDSNEVSKEIESNQISLIESDSDEKRILEREKYLEKYNEYSILIHREIYKLIKEGRVRKLSMVI